MSPGFLDRLATWPQYLLPQQLLTSLAWRLSKCEARWFRIPFIRIFIRLFGVDMNEAERSDPTEYRCFNDFFTRALTPGARPLARARLTSPCDGRISQLGRISGGTLIQAKGMTYSAATLLGDDQRARPFTEGHFITIYLAPYDYHRVHSPIAGRVVEEVRIPGRLFSVSAATVRGVPRLFARNERMVSMLDTEHGPVAVVMVAALLVAGIETAWGGPGQRRPERGIQATPLSGYHLKQGAELGRFHWGSTVIVLTPRDFPGWHESLQPDQRLLMGQALTSTDS